MIKKYLKISYLIILCILCSMHTFAAISISDGSAFISKSEFMADVENLSSRISQLELNIDKDLDEKVTSYMNQKSFWREKPQQINVGEKDYKLPAIAKNTRIFSDKSAEYELITRVENTGLLFFDIDFIAQNKKTDSYNFQNIGYRVGNGLQNLRTSSIVLYLNFTERLENGEINDLGNVLIGQAVGQKLNSTNQSYYTILAVQLCGTISKKAMFYVNKNSSILYSFNLSVANSCDSTFAAGSYCADALKCKIKNAIVY